ncbi:hypothetical protein HYN69_02860 [Gemmobacter aquarius]|uniref:Uncharacterized protein n=1 Tax=Paragemmobacter aquarius TaxID=2169400 RepID=A0A2S0UIE3_9RHOB|nr:hypothetical protein [Gemmobacter aquarius]AWB47586.1 hypothetical protein HYN69_02860 [Gemmobacter aquarius]
MNDFVATDMVEPFSIDTLYKELEAVVAEKSLLSPDWSHVRKQLEELYRLATIPIRLTSPFPELCAYRLAHVMMRDARDSSDFARVLALLDEPCGQPAFGSRPHLLRVAALHRLRLLEPAAVSDADIKGSFEKALDLARRPEERGEEAGRRAVTQRVTANLIEQTGYLLGLPFAGRIDPDFVSEATPRGKWTVLIRGVPMIWMTEPLARLFYEESVKRIKPVIQFEWLVYPTVKFSGTNLKGMDATLAATLCLSEHDEDALRQAMSVERGHSVGTQLGSNENRLNKHLSGFRDKITALAAEQLEGANPVEGTIGAVNLRFATPLTHVGLLEKSAAPKAW